MNGPDLSNGQRRSASGTKASSIRQFCSAIFTGQNRRPPGYPDGKLSADPWLGKEMRGSCRGKILGRVNRPANLGQQ
jgi:hypothetical protein